MSVLEFISSLKWPIVVLVVVGVATFLVVKYDSMREALSGALKRLRSVKFPGGEIALDSAAGAAAQTDQTLIEQGVDASAVQQFRREAVEEIIRQAAAWGWDAAHIGTFQREPVPVVTWEGDKPTIQFGVAGAASSHSRMLQEWLRRVSP